MSEFDQAKIRRLDGGLLLVFHHLLRLRRATEVGMTLGLSPSAVSHALSRLRDLYADPLFIRRPHGLEPTARALALGPQIEALLAMAGATLPADEAFDPKTSRRWFNLAAPEFVAALIGGRLARALDEQAPGIGFQIHIHPPDEALELVRRGQIDLAAGRFPRLAPGLTSQVLFEDDYCLIARRDHPRVSGAITEAELVHEKYIWASAESEVAEDLVVEEVNHLRVQASVPRWLTVLVMVAASDALGAVPRRLAESQAGLLGLQVLEEPFGRPRRFAVTSVRREGAADAGLAWFLDRVRAAAA